MVKQLPKGAMLVGVEKVPEAQPLETFNPIYAIELRYEALRFDKY